jgi:hypothetical protein
VQFLKFFSDFILKTQNFFKKQARDSFYSKEQLHLSGSKIKDRRPYAELLKCYD